MDFQNQGTSSVSYQQVNQVWVSQSPDPELVNQAAGAVLQAQTEAHHAQTEAYQTRTEAERVIRETQVSAEMHVQQLENRTRLGEPWRKLNLEPLRKLLRPNLKLRKRSQL
jgi:uncharacterized membrane protein YqiK